MRKVSLIAWVPVAALSVFFGFSCAAPSAQAASAGSACVEGYGTRGILDFETVPLSDDSCVTELTPNTISLSYRSFLFDNRGGLLIFNTVPGSEANSDGSRSYFFFPRQMMPSYQIVGDTFALTNASGIVFNFSTKTAELVSIPGVVFNQDPTVSMTNNGGIEILAAPGVWFDSGWMTGGAAYQVPTGHSTIHSGSATCEVTNSELFDIVNTSPLFKFPEDKEFAAFLKARCPGLDISSLQ